VLPTTTLKNCTHSFLLPNIVCQAIDSSATKITDKNTAAGTARIKKIAIVVLFMNKLLQNMYHGRLEYLFDKKQKHIELTVRRLQKKDEFRWLSLVPVKDKVTGRVIEGRYVNIKVGAYGSYGYNLLTETNEFWSRVYHLRKHPEDITEEERQEAIDMVLEENEMIQYDLPEIQKKREEEHKTLARERKERLMQESKRKLEKRLKRGQTPGQAKLFMMEETDKKK
jgi:hypothetical protein